MARKISTEKLLTFINNRKRKVNREFLDNEVKSKKTVEPAELVRLNHSNSRIFGRQKELTVLNGFIVNNSENDGRED